MRLRAQTILFLLSLIQGKVFGQSADSLFSSAIHLIPDQPEKVENIALDLLRRFGKSESHEAKAYLLLGISNYYQTRLVLSTGYYQYALKLPYGINNLKFRESVLNNLGVVLELQGRYHEAMENYQESLKLAANRKDKRGVAQTLLNIGSLKHQLSNLDGAVDDCQTALEEFKELQDTANIALAMGNLGMYLAAKGDFLSSQAMLKDAILLYQHTGSLYNITRTNTILADVLLANKKFNLALPLLETGIKTAIGLGYETQLAMQLHLKAKCYIQQALEPDSVLVWINKASEIYWRTRDNRETRSLIATRILYHNKFGNPDDVEFWLDSLNSFDFSFNVQIAAKTVTELDVLYKLEESRIKTVTQAKSLNLALLAILLLIFLLSVAIYSYFVVRSKNKALYQANRRISNTEINTLYNSNQDGNSIDQKEFKQILDLIKNDKLYLNQNFSLETLSETTGKSTRHLSRIINTCSNSNFSTLVNNFRVDEARHLIIKHGKEMPLIEIGTQCGFGTRFTFYRQFKEITGLSPTEFLNFSQEHNIN